MKSPRISPKLHMKIITSSPYKVFGNVVFLVTKRHVSDLIKPTIKLRFGIHAEIVNDKFVIYYKNKVPFAVECVPPDDKHNTKSITIKLESPDKNNVSYLSYLNEVFTKMKGKYETV